MRTIWGLTLPFCLHCKTPHSLWDVDRLYSCHLLWAQRWPARSILTMLSLEEGQRWFFKPILFWTSCSLLYRGLTLAGRLSAIPSINVLVIETGLLVEDQPEVSSCTKSMDIWKPDCFQGFRSRINWAKYRSSQLELSNNTSGEPWQPHFDGKGGQSLRGINCDQFNDIRSYINQSFLASLSCSHGIFLPF